MSQGYLGKVTLSSLPGNKIQFQNATIHVGADTIDTSSSLNEDGSQNAGYSDVAGDLGTTTFDIDTVMKDDNALYLLSLYEVGVRYPATSWTAQYNGEGYEGDGIYIIDKSMTFRVPGEARIRMSFRSLQTGFDIGTFS